MSCNLEVETKKKKARKYMNSTKKMAVIRIVETWEECQIIITPQILKSKSNVYKVM